MTETSTRRQELVDTLHAHARSASENAWSPYSKVKVGAAVLHPDGRIYSGCNVENASYGLTQCAERNALVTAVADGIRPGSLSALLVYATGFEVLTPCGACRQVMSEIMAADASVVVCSENGDSKIWRVSELLPDPFSLK